MIEAVGVFLGLAPTNEFSFVVAMQFVKRTEFGVCFPELLCFHRSLLPRFSTSNSLIRNIVNLIYSSGTAAPGRKIGILAEPIKIQVPAPAALAHLTAYFPFEGIEEWTNIEILPMFRDGFPHRLLFQPFGVLLLPPLHKGQMTADTRA